MSRYELKSINALGQSNDKPADSLPSAETNLPKVELIMPSRLGPELDSNKQPVDRYNLVFIILLLHGIGTLMPWNMFITAENYFKNYKLKPSDMNMTRDRTEDELADLRKNFVSYLSFNSQLPNLLFNGFNLLFNLGSGNLKLRVNLTLIVEAILFFATIILASVDSYAWPGTFFYVTMISVIILNMASGIYQNCVFGIGAKFPGKYTNAILIGSNLSGTFTSVVNLLSIWLAPEPQEAAIYYFITALIVLMVCLISYNILNLNPFFRHYDQAVLEKQEDHSTQLEIAFKDDSQLQKSNEDNDNDIPEALRNTVDAMVPRPNSDKEQQNDNSFIGGLNRKWQIFKKCWAQCLNVFFTFYFTLALFPAVLVSIQSVRADLNSKYFVAIACFLVFNVFAMLGNLISGFTTWPGKDNVWTLVAVRALFVPFFLFCNFNPNSRKWPVLFNDIAYITGNGLFAVSSGYLSSLCMMFASSNLKRDEAPIAGMLAAFFLIFGIFIGINSSFILTWAVEIGI